MRSERIPFVTRFVRVTGKGRPLQGGGSFFMRFRLEGFSLSFFGMGKTLLFCPVYSPFPRTVVYWCPGRPDASKPPERRPPGTNGPLNERGWNPRRL